MFKKSTPFPHRQKRRISALLTLSVTTGLFTSCGLWNKPSVTAPGATQPSAAKGYVLAGEGSSDGRRTQLKLTVRGEQRHFAGLIRINLPAGANVVSAAASSGTAQYLNGELTFLAGSTTETLVLQLEHSTAPSQLSVQLMEASAGDQPAAAGKAVDVSIRRVKALTLSSDGLVSLGLNGSQPGPSRLPLNANTHQPILNDVPSSLQPRWLDTRLGDVDQNGRINAADLVKLGHALTGHQHLTEPQRYLADLVDDSTLDIQDLRALLHKQLALRTNTTAAVPSFHPTAITGPSGSQHLLSVGNAGVGPLPATEITASAGITVAAVASETHPEIQAYTVTLPDVDVNSGPLHIKLSNSQRSVTIPVNVISAEVNHAYTAAPETAPEGNRVLFGNAAVTLIRGKLSADAHGYPAFNTLFSVSKRNGDITEIPVRTLGQDTMIESATATKDGRIIFASTSQTYNENDRRLGQYRVYRFIPDSQSYQPMVTFKGVHVEGIRDVTLSPDETRLAFVLSVPQASPASATEEEALHGGDLTQTLVELPLADTAISQSGTQLKDIQGLRVVPVDAAAALDSKVVPCYTVDNRLEPCYESTTFPSEEPISAQALRGQSLSTQAVKPLVYIGQPLASGVYYNTNGYFGIGSHSAQGHDFYSIDFFKYNRDGSRSNVTGTPILSVGQGLVTFAAEGCYGKNVKVYHEWYPLQGITTRRHTSGKVIEQNVNLKGMSSLYAHMRSFNVRAMSLVSKGGMLGEANNTTSGVNGCYSTAPHLHISLHPGYWGSGFPDYKSIPLATALRPMEGRGSASTVEGAFKASCPITTFEGTVGRYFAFTGETACADLDKPDEQQGILSGPTPTAMAFELPVGASGVKTFEFGNSGNGPLNYALAMKNTSGTTNVSTVFTSNVGDGSLTAGQKVKANVNVTCTQEGIDRRVIALSSSNGSGTVTVSINCIADGRAKLVGPAPAAIALTAKVGQSAQGAFTFSNDGPPPKTLTYTLGLTGGGDIAKLSFVAPVGNGTLSGGESRTVTVAAACLKPGTTTAQALVDAQAAGSGAVTLNVTCLGAQLGPVAPTSLALKAKVGQSDTKAFTASNVGNVDLAYAAPLATVIEPADIAQLHASSGTGVVGKDGGTQSFNVTATCFKPGTSAGTVKVVRLAETGGEPVVPADEVTVAVAVTCEPKLPQPQLAHAITSKTSSYGTECSQTTRTTYFGQYTVTLPKFDTAGIKQVTLSASLGGATSQAPWMVKGQVGSGTHTLVGQLSTDVGSTQNQAQFTVPPDVEVTATWQCGGNAGDPHLSSLDGQRFSFQGVGEYVFARTPDRAFDVQARFHQAGEQGSANSAIAMNVAGDRVGLYALNATQGSSGLALLRLNGQDLPISLTSTQTLNLPRGGRVHLSPARVRVEWPDGNFVSLHWQSTFFDFVTVGVTQAYLGRIEGLLGNADKNRSNDFQGRDGTQYPNPPSFEQLYKGFGDSWRIQRSESLFDYAAGQDTSTFTNLNFPPPPVPFSAAAQAEAEAICRAVGVVSSDAMENCIFDVANLQPTDPQAAQQMAQAAAAYDPQRPTASISPARSETLPGSTLLLGAIIRGDAQTSEIQWRASAGSIITHANGTAAFTAPQSPGAITITASLRGLETTGLVDVRSALIDVPAELQVFEAQSQPIRARLIGNPSDIQLEWNTQRGTVNGTGTEVQYTAPAGAGEDIVTVQVHGDPSTAVSIPVKVNAPYINLSPNAITVDAGDTVGLNVVTAGFSSAPYLAWSSTGGALTTGLSAAQFQAPNEAGDYLITATVAARPDIRAQARIVVRRTEAVTALQMPAAVHAGERVRVRALGTNGTLYTSSELEWSASGGQLMMLGQGEVDFLAGEQPGQALITARVKRRASIMAEQPIAITLERPIIQLVNSSATSVLVPVNETLLLRATKADGAPYPVALNWEATGGDIQPQVNGTVAFKAGVTTGDYVITAAPKFGPDMKQQMPVRVVQRITGETRFVLTWGASPRDLDTHLWLPASTPYHVYYGNRGSDTACPFAQLDQDETNGFGPEVMRVKGLTGSIGVYSLQVKNYSQVGTFTAAQAKIDVISTATGEVLATVTPPADNAPGIWWNVLTFDAQTGIINVINTVGGLTEPYYETTQGCSITTNATSSNRVSSLSMRDAQDATTKPLWIPNVSNQNR